MSVDQENDLPVLANTSQILVHHFVLDLTCCLKGKQFCGSILLFLDPANSSNENRQIFSIREVGKTQGQDGANRTLDTSTASHNLTRTAATENCNEDCSHDNALTQPEKECSSCRLSDVCDVEAGKHDADHSEMLPYSPKEDFQLILDCCDLVVDNAEEVLLPADLYTTICDQYSRCNENPTVGQDLLLECNGSGSRPLKHSSEKWCLKIWKEGVNNAVKFPRVIRVNYRTTPEGKSLRWTTDQSGR